jgi:hypothetical protein
MGGQCKYLKKKKIIVIINNGKMEKCEMCNRAFDRVVSINNNTTIRFFNRFI